MKLVFLKKFSKDLDKIRTSKDKEAIREPIELIRSCHSIDEIKSLKKLKGFKDAYRIRIGDFRMGVFIEADIVIFARIAHRKDIYNIFP
jgi:mRNA interferase RelE/StbE